MALEHLSCLELGDLVRSRQISPVEVIQYFANVIDDRNPSVNAFTYTMIDEALDHARDMEYKIINDNFDPGPFAGVPFGLKDFLPSKKGWKNSHGGVKSLIAVDDSDSMFCKAAEKLGGIAIGKTNAPAFGFSGACQNKMYGQTKNPFDLNRTSGGSSGGSAAAVSDGMLPICEGGDAGGSIRIPSAWCNLFGFKPSVGSVPSYCRPDAWTATHPYCFNGSLTRTVSDSVIMFNEMAQYDPMDPISLPINANKNFVELVEDLSSVKDLKIGVTPDFGIYEVDEEVAKIVNQACRCFEYSGIFVDGARFNFKHSLYEIMYCWAWAISVDTSLDIEMWKNNGLDLIGDHSDELPGEFIKFNDIAYSSDIHSFRTFNEIRTDILDQFESAFEEYDVIVSPTTACPPLPNEWNGRAKYIDGVEQSDDINFISFGETPMANFIGYPAASVPAGLTDSGLPIGMQIIGKKYHDEDVLRLSKHFEDIHPWFKYYEIPWNRSI